MVVEDFRFEPEVQNLQTTNNIQNLILAPVVDFLALHQIDMEITKETNIVNIGEEHIALIVDLNMVLQANLDEHESERNSNFLKETLLQSTLDARNNSPINDSDPSCYRGSS